MASSVAAFIEYGVIETARGWKLGWRTPLRGLEDQVMMLCGQISIELVVDDFIEAADHQKRMEALMAAIRQTYPQATLNMRERRERRVLGLASGPRRATALTSYSEA